MPTRRPVAPITLLALAAIQCGCNPLESWVRRHQDPAPAAAEAGGRAPSPVIHPHASPAGGQAFAVKDASALAPALRVEGAELVDEHGAPVALHGLNYFGFNDGTSAPAGLWGNDPIANDFANIVLRQRMLGFNAVRLPFSFAAFNTAPRDFSCACVDADAQAIAKSMVDPKTPGADISRAKPLPSPPERQPGQCNHYLPQDSVRARVVWVAQFYIANGFYVMLDNHFREDQTATTDPAGWARAWGELVRDVLSMPEAEGRLLADLLNEPGQHGVGWDTGAGGGVHKLYLQAMDAIHQVSPKVPLVIEGTGQDGLGANWGDGFCADAEKVKVNGLGDPGPFFAELAGKPYAHNVVLGPHVYGPSVTNAPQWSDGSALFDRLTSSFGGQMVAGVQVRQTQLKFPVLVGEFGSKFGPEDANWLRDFSKYQRGEDGAAKHLPLRNWFYWSWNPNSGDTGGLVADDWKALQWTKIEHLVELGLTPFYAAAMAPPGAPASGAAASPPSAPPPATPATSAHTVGPGAGPPSASPAPPASAPSATRPPPVGHPASAPAEAPHAPRGAGHLPAWPPTSGTRSEAGGPPRSPPSPVLRRINVVSRPPPSAPGSAHTTPPQSPKPPLPPGRDVAEPAIARPPAGQPAPPSAPPTTPADEAQCEVDIDVDLSGEWHQDGKHFASLNLYLSNTGEHDIDQPYQLDVENSAYQELGMSWNIEPQHTSLKEGHIISEVGPGGQAGWQMLKARRGNAVPIGFLVCGDGSDLAPTAVHVNGRACRLRMLPKPAEG